MKQPFATAELQAELERALGFRLRSLRRLDGASALNFRAERGSDGMVFAVKCSPAARQEMFDHLVEHLEVTAGTKAVRRLFAAECPARFRGFNLICLSWCAGERRFPDRLGEAELLDFLDDYRDFSTAMQRSTLVAPVDPVLEWRGRSLAAVRGFWGRPVRALIERELPVADLTYVRERLRVVHGDFHHGNFLFTDGKVNGFFDLEEFCMGYPADDIVRYFVCAAEHLKWYERHRLRRLRLRFAAAVRHLGYPRDEWTVAINALLMRKLYKKTEGGCGLFQALNLCFRARFYRRLRLTVAAILV